MFFVLAGFLGCTAIALDAVASHFLPNWLSLPPQEIEAALRSWQTATRTQVTNALLFGIFAMLVASKPGEKIPLLGGLLVILGSAFFCGGIYLKILLNNPVLGRAAPFGGVCFMLAWLCLCFVSPTSAKSAFRRPGS